MVRETKPKILVEEADFLGRREVLGGEGTELRWLGDGDRSLPCEVLCALRPPKIRRLVLYASYEGVVR